MEKVNEKLVELELEEQATEDRIDELKSIVEGVEEPQILTIDMLSKSHEKFENIKEVLVELEIDGELKSFKLEMYKVFSPVGVKECVAEFIENIDVAKNVDKNGFGDIAEPYMLYLLIKHFTTLGEGMPNIFKEQLISLKHMINTGALFQIVMHFDETEISRITDEIENALTTFEDNYQILEQIKEKYKDKIENKDLLD